MRKYAALTLFLNILIIHYYHKNDLYKISPLTPFAHLDPVSKGTTETVGIDTYTNREILD